MNQNGSRLTVPAPFAAAATVPLEAAAAGAAAASGGGGGGGFGRLRDILENGIGADAESSSVPASSEPFELLAESIVASCSDPLLRAASGPRFWLWRSAGDCSAGGGGSGARPPGEATP